MKTYIRREENGIVWFEIGDMTIPESTNNRHYHSMLTEVELGEAVIENEQQN